MAESPAHVVGEAIGVVLEAMMGPVLQPVATKLGLYLDSKGGRKARRGSKVAWCDSHGNRHDLDYVFERDGSEEKRGDPVAFIECAWRRYTKHSRNKAQEIQGAIMPLRETYRTSVCFAGIVVAGDFTDGALKQLESHGFVIAHLDYESVVGAFAQAGMGIRFDEDTTKDELERMGREWQRLVASEDDAVGRVGKALRDGNRAKIDAFVTQLETALSRRIVTIGVLPLHGREVECGSVDEAVSYIDAYSLRDIPTDVRRYDVYVRFSNGDRVEGSFASAGDAVRFLRSM